MRVLRAGRRPGRCVDRRRATSAPLTFVVLNAFPYGSGHVLVLPRRHVAGVEDLPATSPPSCGLDDAGAAGDRGRLPAPTAPTSAPTSVGLAGRGSPATCTSTPCPAGRGDTNFMTSVAETRVLPESLERDLREAPRGLRRAAMTPAGVPAISGRAVVRPVRWRNRGLQSARPARRPTGQGGPMFDGRFREAVDRRTVPIGRALERAGV